MILSDELEKGTLSKVKEDEPLFVLRARDELAPRVVRFWADVAAIREVDPNKIMEARSVANLMEKWTEKNGSKLPD
jgi:hypothetical protein